jgi:magnesium-protoporphyrin O-methyltransferase
MKTISAVLALVALSTYNHADAFAPAFAPRTANSVVVTHMATGVDDKTEVREYFNTEGFSRWNKIYSESEDVNSVQLDIRKGHGITIEKILKWVEADGDIAGKTVCDCGCGVGSLAIPLAQMGTYSIYLTVVSCFRVCLVLNTHTHKSCDGC